MTYTYIIIGASAAGIAALNRLQQLDPQAPKLIISAESQAYNKCLLINYGSDEIARSSLLLKYTDDAHTTFKWGARVVSLDCSLSTITLDDGSAFSFKRLLIATGCRPIIPDVLKHTSFENLFFLHTLTDTQILKDQNQRCIAIIGAGLTGLECADMLTKKGHIVTLIERDAYFLSSFISAEQSKHIEQKLQELKIDYRLSTEIKQVHAQNNRITGLEIDNNGTIECDLFICAAGTLPNNQFAQRAGIVCTREGIIVNDYFQTSQATIYAAGDVICRPEMGGFIRSTTWTDAVIQGYYAAWAMSGKPRAYPGIRSRISSRFFGLHLAKSGSQSVSFLTEKE